MKLSKQLVSDLFLLSISIIWGSTFILLKNAVSFISPLGLISLRFIFAAIILIVIFYKKIRFINSTVIWQSTLIGICLFGSLIFQVIGLQYTKASNSAFITGLNVIFVPIIASIYLKEKTRLNTIIGIALSFIGLFFITGGLNFSFNIGDFFTLLCAICVSFQIILIDKYSNKHNGITLGILQILIAAIFSNIFWITIDFTTPVFNYHVILAIIVTGILGTAYAFTCQTVVQKNTSASRAALIFSTEPVFALIFAINIPDITGNTEILNLNSFLGCMLILTGMICSEIEFKFLKFKKTKIQLNLDNE